MSLFLSGIQPPLRISALIFCLFTLCASAFSQENLIEGLLGPQDGQLPPIIRTDGHHAKITEQVKVDADAYVIDNTESGGDESIVFESSPLPNLKVGCKYLLSVEVKVESLELLSPSTDVISGLIFYFYQAGGDAHIWAAITGSGATDGWVKAVIPIDTEAHVELVRGYTMVSLRLARAKIRFRNFKLEAVEETPFPRPYFILPDGSKYEKNIYHL